MVDHLAKLEALWQKAAQLKTVETIVGEVKMKFNSIPQSGAL